MKYKVLVWFLFSMQICRGQPVDPPEFNYNYAQTLVLKLFLSKPDNKGGSDVYCNLEQALDLIRQTDHITLGVPKIIYLVGWQYDGHDDKYPAFFEVNKKLKCPADSSAKQSLTWLMKEALKYHTVVSLHINMTDAYENSPLWQTYLTNDLISKNQDGSLMVIGDYNGRKAYQINYRNEWEKGFAQKRIDQLVALLPLKKAATIHIDAWFARESKGHQETQDTEIEYQRKILDYWRSEGIDVTSEFVIKYFTGSIPYAWHFNQSQADYLKIPATVYTGTGINRDLGDDHKLDFLFGRSMHGETIWMDSAGKKIKAGWQTSFTESFYLNCLQYFFLNNLDRKAVTQEADHRVAVFSGGVETALADSTVKWNGLTLRAGSSIFFPVKWSGDDHYAIFSKKPMKKQQYQLPESWRDAKVLSVRKITPQKLEAPVFIRTDKKYFYMDVEPGTAYLVHPKTN